MNQSIKQIACSAGIAGYLYKSLNFNQIDFFIQHRGEVLLGILLPDGRY